MRTARHPLHDRSGSVRFISQRRAPDCASLREGAIRICRSHGILHDVSHRPVLREVRDRYLNLAAPPASTLIGVTALAFPEWMVEIEAVAVVPER